MQLWWWGPEAMGATRDSHHADSPSTSDSIGPGRVGLLSDAQLSMWLDWRADPETIARKRENAKVVAQGANRAVRLVYATLAILLILVIVLAIILT